MEQIRHLLTRAVHLYENLSRHYESLERTCTRTRVHMMLEYLKSHAEHQARVLEDFEKSVPGSLKESWIIFPPDPDRWELATTSGLSADDTGDLLEEALQIDESIIGIYRDLSWNAESLAARELFSNLEMQARKERNRFVRDTMMLEDC